MGKDFAVPQTRPMVSTLAVAIISLALGFAGRIRDIGWAWILADDVLIAGGAWLFA